MKSLAYLVPAKKHYSYKCGFQKESHNPFNGQGRAKNIAYKPGIIRPVGSKFKLENNACGHPNGEIDAKNSHPEFSNPLPGWVAGFNIDRFHNGDNESQPQCEGNKYPVIHGRKRKLTPRPIYQ